MLQSVTLKNFQSHKNSKLNFDKGVNVIVGTSDSGKSAILRALNSCIYGELPNTYRTYNSDETEVSIDVSDKTVTRRRGDKTNEYQVNNSFYKALNRTVPEDIVNLFNMNDINIQYQLDGPFLLSETPGEVAKRLNKTVNLDIIDSSTKQINTMRNDVNSALKHQTEQATKYEDDLKVYANLDSFEQCINELADITEKRDNITKDIQRIGYIQEEVSLCNARIDLKKDEKEPLVKALNKLNKITALDEDVCILKDTFNELNTILKSYQEVISKIKVSQKVVKESNTCLKVLNNITNIIERGKEIREVHTTLNNIVEAYKLCMNTLELHNTKLKKQKAELEEIMPDVCPLCGHTINKEG